MFPRLAWIGIMLYPTLGGLSHARRGPRGCADGLWLIQDSLQCDLSPWWLGLALTWKCKFGLKNKIYLLRLLNSHCQSFVLNSQSKTWAGNSNAVFLNRQNWPPNQKQLLVCSQLAVNFQPAHLWIWQEGLFAGVQAVHTSHDMYVKYKLSVTWVPEEKPNILESIDLKVENLTVKAH